MQIERKIVSKVKKIVTLKRISEECGVSTTTVSRVLSGQATQYRIKKETEKIVKKMAKKLNYVPNQLARGLRLKRSFSIGLVLPDIANPFFATIAKNISIEAHKLGYSLLLSDSQDDTKIEINSINYMKNRVVDGFIVCPVGQQFDHFLNFFDQGEKMVIVDRYFPDLNCPSIISDNYKGVIEGIDYFIENGHSRIGFIQGELNNSVNDERIQGYKEALNKHNIPLNDSLIIGDSFGERNGYISTKLLLHRSPRVTAIFASSNLISLGALRAISEEGLKIPDDISLISFDDQPYSDLLNPPMTTIIQQKEEIGKLAFKLLMDQINTKEIIKTQVIVMPTKLIKRKSVKRINEY